MRRIDEITYPSDVRVYFDAEKKLAIFENKGAYPVYEIFAIAPTKNARVLGKYIYSNVVPKLEAGSETKVPLIERKADYNITEELKKQGFTVSEASEFSGLWTDKVPNTKKSLGMLSYRASPEELEVVSGSIGIEPEASKTLQSLYVLVTLTGRDYLPPVIGTGFGIYQGQMLIISEEDIIDYNRTRHEIRLTPEGLMKLRSRIPYEEEKGELVPKLGGLYLKPFTVRLNGQEIYSGTFWSSASSQSNDGVVLLDVLSILSQDRIKLQAGYPSKEYFKGADPRDNTQLMNYLEGKSKLVT